MKSDTFWISVQEYSSQTEEKIFTILIQFSTLYLYGLDFLGSPISNAKQAAGVSKAVQLESTSVVTAMPNYKVPWPSFW